MYNIMILLTDGQIMDMGNTKAEIVTLSKMPVSIIIIGVGDADFSSMSELDGDDGPLKDNAGNACSRDIVQFVAYKEAIKKGDLAQQVLAEVPPQLCSYMDLINFKPQIIQQDITKFAPEGPPPQQQ